MDKGEIAQNEQFRLFPQCLLCNLYLKITFKLSSASSLNSGRSQKGVLGNRLSLVRQVRKDWFVCLSLLFAPLPNDNFSDWSKLKAFADDKVNVPRI